MQVPKPAVSNPGQSAAPDRRSTVRRGWTIVGGVLLLVLGIAIGAMFGRQRRSLTWAESVTPEMRALRATAEHESLLVTRSTETYRKIKAEIDAIPAIDTHEHLPPFEYLHTYTHTKSEGKQVNVHGLWRDSYLSWHNQFSFWTASDDFDSWWERGKDEFKNVRATSFYRCLLPAFQDLYGIDFDRITDDEVKELNARIISNYQEERWLYEVVTERANIELMFNDPYWDRFGFAQSYPWEVKVFNVTSLVHGYHPSQYDLTPSDSPYRFAKKHGLAVETFDEYLNLIERLFMAAKDNGAVCLKSILAYERTLHFENVPKERAEKAFGRRRTLLTDQEARDFEDFIFWHLCHLSAKYDLPFQIHTGQGRIQSSNPMLLVDLIQANPHTKFILFHGGFPWVGETGAIAQKHASHVWVDSVWLPMLSFSMAKRAFHEWLEMFPSNRIMWGGDSYHAEGIYGATEYHRRCLCEVLTEKVLSGDLTEEQALGIGRQIMRENALELFPQLKERLWKHTGEKLVPAATPKK